MPFSGTLQRHVLTVVILAVSAVVGAWWDENCAENGQCPKMFASYEALMSGEGCRSFYVTGKCSRLCTYSLKSLIGRHTWARCAKRCEWSKAKTDGALSWLEMCLANPAQDVFESEEKEHSGTDATKANIGSGKGASLEGGKSRSSSHNIVVYSLIMVGLVVCIASIALTPSLNGKAGDILRRFMSWIRVQRGKRRHGRTPAGKGPLDMGPDRNELRNLQRGARRHLKAMRATLD